MAYDIGSGRNRRSTNRRRDRAADGGRRPGGRSSCVKHVRPAGWRRSRSRSRRSRLCVGKGGADMAPLQLAALSAGGLSLHCWRAELATRSDVCAAGARGARAGALGEAYARTAWAPRCGTAAACAHLRAGAAAGAWWMALHCQHARRMRMSVEGGVGLAWLRHAIICGSYICELLVSVTQSMIISVVYLPALSIRGSALRAWPCAKCTRGASGSCQPLIICPCTVPGCHYMHCFKDRLPETLLCLSMQPTVSVSGAGSGRAAPCCTAGASLCFRPTQAAQAPRPYMVSHGRCQEVMKLKQTNSHP